jgi:hypothetical protein
MPVKIHQFTVQAKMKTDSETTSNTIQRVSNGAEAVDKEELIEACMERVMEKLERHLNLKLD